MVLEESFLDDKITVKLDDGTIVGTSEKVDRVFAVRDSKGTLIANKTTVENAISLLRKLAASMEGKQVG